MVRYVPNVVVPPSAPTLPLTEFVQASAPIGSVNLLLDRLAGVYSPVDLAVIRAAYHKLMAADVLRCLDVLAFKLSHEPDSLLNWAGSGAAENHGGSFGAKAFLWMASMILSILILSSTAVETTG